MIILSLLAGAHGASAGTADLKCASAAAAPAILSAIGMGLQTVLQNATDSLGKHVDHIAAGLVDRIDVCQRHLEHAETELRGLTQAFNGRRK